MGLPTILDIANRNASDAAVGLIDEASKVCPELRLGFARTITGTMYKTLVRTANPTVAFRDENEGVVPGKSTTELRNVETYILNPRFHVSKSAADGSEDGWEAYLADEGIAMTEAAFAHAGAQFYYGTSNDSKGFTGLISSIDSTMEVDAAGTGNACSSVFGVKWGRKDLSWVIGKDGDINLSDVRVSDIVTSPSTGATLTMYVQELLARLGLQVSNKNAIGRIRDTNSAKPLDDDMLSDLISKFPAGRGPDMFLMNRTSLAQLQQSRSATSSTGAPAPFPKEAFDVPIVVTDSITTTESAV